jgi:hypothetical protein
MWFLSYTSARLRPDGAPPQVSVGHFVTGDEHPIALVTRWNREQPERGTNVLTFFTRLSDEDTRACAGKVDMAGVDASICTTN